MSALPKAPEPGQPPTVVPRPDQAPQLPSAAAFVTDSDFQHDLVTESRAPAAAVLIVAAIATLLIAGSNGWLNAGLGGAVGAGAVALALLGLAAAASGVAGSVIGRIFHADDDTFGGLLLRCGAVAAVVVPLHQLLSPLFGPGASVLACMPVVLLGNRWLAGLPLAAALAQCAALAPILWVVSGLLDQATA